MTCNTGDSNMEAVTAKWNYWTTEAVSKDASMMQDLKNVMMWQNYALANSNAMDGLNETSQIKDVRTWYDNALTATSAVLALLTLAAAAMYIRDAKRRKTVKRVCYEFYQKTGCRLLSDAACTNSRNSRNRILCDQLQHGIFFQSWNQLGSCRMSCGRSGSGNSFCGRTGKSPEMPVLDILPILAGVLLMAGFVFFVRLRVNSIATILSFERNAQTMADLSSAIIGMGCTLAAVIMTIISSFFRTVREGKIEKSEGCLITGTLILTFENRLGILRKNNR